MPTHVLFLCRNKYVSAVEDTEVLYLHILISLAYNTAEKGYWGVRLWHDGLVSQWDTLLLISCIWYLLVTTSVVHGWWLWCRQIPPNFIANIILAPVSYATVVKAPGTKSYNINLPNNQLVNNVGNQALNVMYNQHEIAPLTEQPSTVNLLWSSHRMNLYQLMYVKWE